MQHMLLIAYECKGSALAGSQTGSCMSCKALTPWTPFHTLRPAEHLLGPLTRGRQVHMARGQEPACTIGGHTRTAS